MKKYIFFLLIAMAAVRGFSAGNDPSTQKTKQDSLVWPNKIPGRDAGLAQMDQGWRVMSPKPIQDTIQVPAEIKKTKK